jgi:calcium binding protein 39
VLAPPSRQPPSLCHPHRHQLIAPFSWLYAFVDAFVTFKDLLTRHKPLVAQFLLENYDAFLERYRLLLESENYVVRRQSVKLLGELLLDRANLKVMMAYVSDVSNLKLMMNLLKDASKSIQFEAFHVFKVFVANPNKTRAIVEVLVNNRDKLLAYLEDFHNDREDEQFKEEKAVIMREIAELNIPE